VIPEPLKQEADKQEYIEVVMPDTIPQITKEDFIIKETQNDNN